MKATTVVNENNDVCVTRGKVCSDGRGGLVFYCFVTRFSSSLPQLFRVVQNYRSNEGKS